MTNNLINICKNSVLVFILLCMALACVDPFDAGLTTNVQKLIVDGEITNRPGPYRVTLQNTSPFGTKDFSPPPFNATVSIADNLGNTEELINLGAGVFETQTTQGIVGRSYTLTVKVGDKKVYKSSAEQIKPAVPIDKVYYEYVPFQANSSIYLGGEFHVFLDTQDPSTSGNYYRWNYTNYNQLDYCLLVRGNGESGRTAFRNRCCESCWEIKPCLGCIYLGADQYNNGKKFEKIFIGKFPFNSTDPVFLKVEQKSLSKDNYYYWKQIDQQINNSGGIFDTPPATILGNMVNVNDPSEQVLGYFAANGVSITNFRFRKYVDGINPTVLGSVEFIDLPNCISCVEGLYRTQKKPEGF